MYMCRPCLQKEWPCTFQGLSGRQDYYTGHDGKFSILCHHVHLYINSRVLEKANFNITFQGAPGHQGSDQGHQGSDQWHGSNFTFMPLLDIVVLHVCLFMFRSLSLIIEKGSLCFNGLLAHHITSSNSALNGKGRPFISRNIWRHTSRIVNNARYQQDPASCFAYIHTAEIRSLHMCVHTLHCE